MQATAASTFAVTTAIPAGTVAQMPEASKLIKGLAALHCSCWLRARAGSAPGRATGPRGKLLQGPMCGASAERGPAESCMFATNTRRLVQAADVQTRCQAQSCLTVLHVTTGPPLTIVEDAAQQRCPGELDIHISKGHDDINTLMAIQIQTALQETKGQAFCLLQAFQSPASFSVSCKLFIVTKQCFMGPVPTGLRRGVAWEWGTPPYAKPMRRRRHESALCQHVPTKLHARPRWCLCAAELERRHARCSQELERATAAQQAAARQELTSHGISDRGG